ncbi:Protein O-mannosyl-transferase TMTC2 like protein [Argiope bruennichi]|uniref:Protein O-mannosyl-transferase TMTC2 like protein n=1 Tax=Argiope bruennichi TaxID=94029 RepID=A0A8T0FFW9_ARGBR|nr:Protein O-mannosyl-transferase TMTC2 like protein [Argiope bruennichi]
MDKLTKIIEKRSSVRSSVTKLLKRAHVALDEEKEKNDLNTLEEILELLGTKEEILKQYNQEVEDLITDKEKFKSELKGSEEYEEALLLWVKGSPKKSSGAEVLPAFSGVSSPRLTGKTEPLKGEIKWVGFKGRRVFYAYGNLANILSGRGEKDEAEWAYKQALSYRANMADVRYNLGLLLQEQQRYDEALYSYRLAIFFRPRLAMAHLNMGLVLGHLGRKDEAVEVYKRCAELDGSGLKDPKNHDTTKISALFNLGRLYADEGEYEKAVEVYHEAVRRMPDYYQAQSLYNMMGT